MSNMSHDNNRRTACDRCRELKLRCPRLEEDNSDTCCARCDRAGALCITSNSRPLGRPRIVAPVSVSPVPTTTTTSDHRRKRPRESSNHVHMQRQSIDRSAAWPSSTTSIDDYSSFLNPAPNAVQAHPHHSESSFDLTFADDDAALLNSLSTLRHQFPPPPHMMGSNVNMGPCSVDMGGMNGILGETPATFDNNPPPQPQPQPQPLDTSTPMISLSRLSESISRQISCLDAYTWGGPDESRLCLDRINDLNENPIAHALHTTADYIKTLERLLPPTAAASMYKSPDTDSAVSLSTPHGLQTPDEPMMSPESSSYASPILLLVLSNYLQLLVLHDAILGRVCQSLRELQDPTKFFQNAPEFSMTIGIPAMKGHLYLKILVQVIEHHIDDMERLIGLPAEFRLSGQPTSTGILSGNMAALNLLHMAMTQLDCIPKRSGESIVASLKSNLEGVQRLIRS